MCTVYPSWLSQIGTVPAICSGAPSARHPPESLLDASPSGASADGRAPPTPFVRQVGVTISQDRSSLPGHRDSSACSTLHHSDVGTCAGGASQAAGLGWIPGAAAKYVTRTAPTIHECSSKTTGGLSWSAAHRQPRPAHNCPARSVSFIMLQRMRKISRPPSPSPM